MRDQLRTAIAPQIRKMIQQFDVELSLTNKEGCEKDAIKILGLLKPCWNLNSIKFQYFTVGITNKIFSARCDSEQLIFRVFGKNTNKIIDRENEFLAWKKLASVGLAAPIYGKFLNGLICGFLEGESLTIQQLRNPLYHSAVATAIANLHEKVPHDSNPTLFIKLRHFLSQFSPSFGDSTKQKFFEEHFSNDLEKDIRQLETFIEKSEERLAFCHNDLLVHNIVHNPQKGTIQFIDYEYASTNYALFDIANHFCEYAGVEGTPDYTLCLTKNQKWLFLDDYLRHFTKEDIESRIKTMFKNLPLFESAAHLMWAIWALVQDQNSTIDFDYLSYAAARYEQYKKRLHVYTKNL